MNKLIKALGIYMTFFAGAVIINACCDNNLRIIGNGGISALDINTSTGIVEADPAPITGPFEIWSNFQTESFSAAGFNLLSSAMATSCPQNFTNDLVENTISISANRSFQFNDTVIEPGTNLLSIETLDYLQDFQKLEFYFHESFMNHAEFENDFYTFIIEATTTDGRNLQNSIRLEFAIQ